ncbi:hypothetical protein ACE6H2_005047 [Prunus campanulata]
MWKLFSRSVGDCMDVNLKILFVFKDIFRLVFIRNDSSCDIVLRRIEMFSSDVGIICTRPSVYPSSRSNLFQLMLYSSTDPQELLVVIQNTENTLLSLLLSSNMVGKSQ